MKLCCFIIPYFGKLPNYFQLFLNSCSYNQEFNWIVFTDDNTPYDYPGNVRKVSQSFEELRCLIQSKFDFDICLEKAYKLCDYKPAYGYIYEEYIQDYRFWGHCDVDTLMGNLRLFITDEIFENYDKIFCLGHMTLYKNTLENNRVFMSEYKGKLLYKDVFQSPLICVFDEEWKNEYNVNQIFISRGKRVFLKDLSLNFSIFYLPFRRTTYTGILKHNNHGYEIEKYRKAVYLWDEGNVIRYSIQKGMVYKEEFLYVHLQQRHMVFEKNLVESNRIQIVPNSFLIPISHVMTKAIIKNTPKYIESIEMRNLNKEKEKRMRYMRWVNFKICLKKSLYSIFNIYEE